MHAVISHTDALQYTLYNNNITQVTGITAAKRMMGALGTTVMGGAGAISGQNNMSAGRGSLVTAATEANTNAIGKHCTMIASSYSYGGISSVSVVTGSSSTTAVEFLVPLLPLLIALV
jgi:hypothetical protein